MSSDKPIWGTPGNEEQSGHQKQQDSPRPEQTPLPYQSPGNNWGRPVSPRRKRGLKVGSWIFSTAVIALVGAGWVGTRAFDGASSSYGPVSPSESQMCQLLSTDEVAKVVGGTAEFKDRIYGEETCRYLVMDTDLGYNVTLETRLRELDADMIDYYKETIEDDVTSTAAVKVEDVGEIAALERPDHRMTFIADGVQYELTLDNNDYDDKGPSSEEEMAASAELGRIILMNAG